MKHLVLAVAMVLGFVIVASSAFANPALLKKHAGYPDETGKASTAVGEAASLQGAESGPKTLKNQNNDARGGVSDRDQLKHSEDSRLPAVVGPGHVTTKGVNENFIKEGTKVNANPK